MSFPFLGLLWSCSVNKMIRWIDPRSYRDFPLDQCRMKTPVKGIPPPSIIMFVTSQCHVHVCTAVTFHACLCYLNSEVLQNGQIAEEQVLLLDVGRDPAHVRWLDGIVVDSQHGIDLKTAGSTVCQ